jgi:DNA-binding Xre family transcriptional regulator
VKINEVALNSIMAERGLNGKELAERADVLPGTISLVRCRTTARHKTVGKIAAALGVSPERILL